MEGALWVRKEGGALSAGLSPVTEAQGVVGIEVVVLDVFSPRWRADLRECRAVG